ncbi:unnamed protein product [Linum trigynum]|uniref:Secreted peptide n=1 Tax=Linum trigynum TaxID=586398 RepID=A0AAV2FJF7_9ROSI
MAASTIATSSIGSFTSTAVVATVPIIATSFVTSAFAIPTASTTAILSVGSGGSRLIPLAPLPACTRNDTVGRRNPHFLLAIGRCNGR